MKINRVVLVAVMLSMTDAYEGRLGILWRFCGANLMTVSEIPDKEVNGHTRDADQ
jgi:hypothetical protein